MNYAEARNNINRFGTPKHNVDDSTILESKVVVFLEPPVDGKNVYVIVGESPANERGAMIRRIKFSDDSTMNLNFLLVFFF